MSTILKSFAVCVVLLGAWHLFVNRLPTKYRVGGAGVGSQQEQNVIRGETYVYASARPRVVVVGSSIANRLRELPRDWFNLSFNGGSAFTGLEIIQRSGRFPNVVLIETNMLLLPADEQQLRQLFTPGVYQARRRLAFLAETNKPHLVAQRVLISEEKHAKQDEAPTTSPTPVAATVEPDAADVVMAREQYNALATRRAGELASAIAPAELDRIVHDLQRHVRELESRGVRVVFFEMPEHAPFTEMPRPTSIRNRLREAFPTDRYAWVPDVDRAAYTTTDFVHLTARGATRYADVLEACVAAIAPKSDSPTSGEPPTVVTPPAPDAPAPAARVD